ncbi:MAG TPA: 7-cyano-7-deazaguanine synthase QueC [Ktedonobacteraceae bacterium]|nr:7-cyano-7-deazaguanine synthase QueC [Ktedonobacteraceae bacterium]
MCSISGFLVTDVLADRARIAEHYIDILARGAERGQDSAGVQSIDEHGNVRRSVSLAPRSYQFAREAITRHCRALIGNNRAEPTTEFVRERTSEDAQPFGEGPIFISHNGIIANDSELRETYGIQTHTRIDSAVLPGLLRRLGFRQALEQVRGSFALAAIDARQPHKLFLARNYKPLFIQARPELGAIFFASRPDHLAPRTAISQQLYQPAIVALAPYSLLEIDGNTMEMREEPLEGREHGRRALVICSGGLDSTTAAKWAQMQGYEITLLHFRYRCRAQEREMAAVQAIACALECDYRFEDLDWLGRLGGSSLTDEKLSITENEASAEFAHEWVPARNLIFCALAAGLCDRYGYDTLVLGLNLEEGGAYPDNTVEFYESLDHVLDIGTTSRPRILCPLASMVKHQIVRLALDIHAPIHLSWSCYYGHERHCGHCGPCFMRRTAFHMLGRQDMISYESA